MEHQLFGLVVSCQHGKIQNHCPDNGRGGSSPESHDALILHDTRESIHHVLVVSALLHWKLVVGLHADKGQISRITNKGSHESCKTGAVGLLEERKSF